MFMRFSSANDWNARGSGRSSVSRVKVVNMVS
jgi:hypothetical protein